MRFDGCDAHFDDEPDFSSVLSVSGVFFVRFDFMTLSSVGVKYGGL